MKVLDTPRFRSVYLGFAFFTLFAGDVWRYSLSWWGFGVIAVALTTVGVILVVRAHKAGSWTWGNLPLPLIAFMGLITLSITWSYYPGGTALGLLTTWMTVIIATGIAVSYTWVEVLRSLGIAMRWILGLSLLFEFIVSAFIRHPVLPIFTVVDISSYEKIPKLLYWSRDLLFEGGKIQGVVGNSSLLAFVGLVSLIVFCVQLADRTVGRFTGIFWALIAGLTIVLTRSATITVALVALVIVTAAVLLIRRSGRTGRIAVYVGLLLLAVIGVVAAVSARTTVLSALGKSDDLTGRLDIWSAVIDLAQQRPAFGWGWVSYWIPWVAPFNDLAFEGGVRQLHAHNAWLDIWLQLGIVGLIIFSAVVLSTTVRAWSFAVDKPQTHPNYTDPYTALSLLPLLLVVALLVQSLAESRLIVEYGLLTLTIIAIKTKIGDAVRLQ